LYQSEGTASEPVGSVHDNDTVPSPRETEIGGIEGSNATVSSFEAVQPAALHACTTNFGDEPAGRFDEVKVRPAVVATCTPLRSNLKLVMLEPFDDGSVHASEAEVAVDETSESDGDPGAPRGVPLTVASAEAPDGFSAATANTYAVPLTRPVIVVGATSGRPGVHSTQVVDVEVRYATRYADAPAIADQSSRIEPSSGATVGESAPDGSGIDVNTSDAAEQPSELHASAVNAYEPPGASVLNVYDPTEPVEATRTPSL